MEENNENKMKNLTQEKFNKIVQEQLNDLRRMFDNKKSKRDDEER